SSDFHLEVPFAIGVLVETVSGKHYLGIDYYLRGGHARIAARIEAVAGEPIAKYLWFGEIQRGPTKKIAWLNHSSGYYAEKAEAEKNAQTPKDQRKYFNDAMAVAQYFFPLLEPGFIAHVRTSKEAGNIIAFDPNRQHLRSELNFAHDKNLRHAVGNLF